MTVLIVIALMASLAASSEEEAVLAAVQQFFDTMAIKDVAGAEQVLVPEGLFFSVRTVGGEKVVRASNNQQYLADLATAEDDWLERMWEPEVRIDGDIATVWTPYDFHINGDFSHCGVDAFNLMNIDGQWKITGGTYTVQRTGCAPSPLGPPTKENRPE